MDPTSRLSFPPEGLADSNSFGFPPCQITLPLGQGLVGVAQLTSHLPVCSNGQPSVQTSMSTIHQGPAGRAFSDLAHGLCTPIIIKVSARPDYQPYHRHLRSSLMYPGPLFFAGVCAMIWGTRHLCLGSYGQRVGRKSTHPLTHSTNSCRIYWSSRYKAQHALNFCHGGCRHECYRIIKLITDASATQTSSHLIPRTQTRTNPCPSITPVSRTSIMWVFDIRSRTGTRWGDCDHIDHLTQWHAQSHRCYSQSSQPSEPRHSGDRA